VSLEHLKWNFLSRRLRFGRLAQSKAILTDQIGKLNCKLQRVRLKCPSFSHLQYSFLVSEGIG
jgi:hypothetical protein